MVAQPRGRLTLALPRHRLGRSGVPSERTHGALLLADVLRSLPRCERARPHPMGYYVDALRQLADGAHREQHTRPRGSTGFTAAAASGAPHTHGSANWQQRQPPDLTLIRYNDS